jgi:phenylacetate-CoA ligase
MNRAMPFIRYKTGDLGAFDEGECECGRGFPLLKVVEGRKDEHLILPSGKKVSPRISDLLHFKFEPYILKYQIYQKKRDKIVIKVVKKRSYTDIIRDNIKKEVKEYINEPVDIEVVEVDDIEKTDSGKFRAVISEVK